LGNFTFGKKGVVVRETTGAWKRTTEEGGGKKKRGGNMGVSTRKRAEKGPSGRIGDTKGPKMGGKGQKTWRDYM